VRLLVGVAIDSALGQRLLQLVNQGFLSDQCDSLISPENGGFDVRWVRFPKHNSLFSTLSYLESVGSWNFSD